MRRERSLKPARFRLEELSCVLPELERLLRGHGVRAAYLFGSVLHTEVAAEDVDIAVLPPPLPHARPWLAYHDRLQGALCRLFGADNIDLVLLDRAPLPLQARVVREGRRLFAVEGVAQWEERVMARYADLAGWRGENWAVTRQIARRGLQREVNMIDRERVQRFVARLREAVQELRALRLEERGLEAYLADKHLRALSEHYLRIALEALLDLGRHLAVRTGLGIPQEYREVGRILGRHGVLPPDLGRKMEAMAGMRNILVHLYWDVDYELLYRVVVEELDHFDAILDYLFRYLEKVGGEGEERPA